jgi:hypothetical protein
MSTDLIEIEKKILKLEKELIDLRNIRTIILAKDFKKKYADKPKSKFYCYNCKKDFESSSSLEKHCWSLHPSNKYEKAWANTNWSTWKGSSYYEDDPYY